MYFFRFHKPSYRYVTGMNRWFKLLKKKSTSKSQHVRPKSFLKNRYRPSPYQYYVLGMNRWFKLPKNKRSNAKTTLSPNELIMTSQNKMATFYPVTSQFTVDDLEMAIIPMTSYPEEEETLLMTPPYVRDGNAVSEFYIDDHIES